MEYSLFEKIELLMDNFESIDEAILEMTKQEMVLHIKTNTNYFSEQKIHELIFEYFQGYNITIQFFV